MLVACPHCQKRIPVSRVRVALDCPSCGTALRSNHSRLLLLTIPLGLLAEAIFLLFLWGIFGRLEVAIFVWSFVGGMAAVFAYWYIINRYTRISIAKGG